MTNLYFITGSQDLYGAKTLTQVAADSHDVVRFLNGALHETASILWQPTVLDSDGILDTCRRASADPDCIGVIAWMHTFSPAKMWIKGLQALSKPLLHLHTQANERLPYESIDMDFMNLNQSAHGDREFGFICTRLGIRREVVVGYYRHPDVIDKIRSFARVARAIAFGKTLKVAMFGSNMRDVAVTDGDRVESQIRYGWEVNYYGIGDIVERLSEVSETSIDAKLAHYRERYDLPATDLEAVRVQARYELALEGFLTEHRIGAFTDTFQDLHGLTQLPGLAVQNLMSKGIGFGAEGDYKTSALNAVMNAMATGKPGATGFMEDYTYDLQPGHERVLGAHMLEVSPAFAAGRPRIEVHPLGIGGKAAPARLVFDGISGDAIVACMIDLGDRFRIICAEVTLIPLPEPMPNLPVARLMWTLKPDFKTGAAAWLIAGGGHHTVLSTAVTTSELRLYAHLTGTEITVIDANTSLIR